MATLLSQLGTLIKNRLASSESPVAAASPSLEMSSNHKVIPVDASLNAVDFQVADGEIKAGYRSILIVKSGTNNVSITRSGTTTTINGGTTESFSTPTAHTHIFVTCMEDDVISVASAAP